MAQLAGGVYKMLGGILYKPSSYPIIQAVVTGGYPSPLLCPPLARPIAHTVRTRHNLNKVGVFFLNRLARLLHETRTQEKRFILNEISCRSFYLEIRN